MRVVSKVNETLFRIMPPKSCWILDTRFASKTAENQPRFGIIFRQDLPLIGLQFFECSSQRSNFANEHCPKQTVKLTAHEEHQANFADYVWTAEKAKP
jgi:hypothetical protein